MISVRPEDQRSNFCGQPASLFLSVIEMEHINVHSVVQSHVEVSISRCGCSFLVKSTEFEIDWDGNARLDGKVRMDHRKVKIFCSVD
jgi:hypothetical protein